MRLLFRCVALAGACWFYGTEREALLRLAGGMDLPAGNNGMVWFLGIVWLILGLGMAARYFPSEIESMGCQKQFQKFYVKRESRESDGETKWNQAKRSADRGALGTLALWCGWNGIVYLLYFRGLFNDGHMLLLCLFYAVCDMVCILYICPFRVLIMKNRCCTTCRIYNWDALMMMTPVLLSRNPAIQVLNLLALGLFLRWEWNWKTHPERFLELTNGALVCKACEHPASCAGCVRRSKRRKERISGDGNWK